MQSKAGSSAGVGRRRAGRPGFDGRCRTLEPPKNGGPTVTNGETPIDDVQTTHWRAEAATKTMNP
jgi:hypothetical protein